MRLEIRRISPVRVANISAVSHGLLGLAMSLAAYAILRFVGLTQITPQMPRVNEALSALSTFYPLALATWGWFSGASFALAYNSVARLIGGVAVEVEVLARPVATPTAEPESQIYPGSTTSTT